MTLDGLKLFRDIAQDRSFSKGAALNGISQSAASQNLQDLERQLGTSLLDRSTRPLSLTDAGKLYLEMCRDVLRRRDDFDAALDLLKSQVEGRLVPIPIASWELFRPVGIVHLRKKRFHRAGQAFLDLLQEPPGAWTAAL